MGITWFVIVASLLGISRGNYPCACNYNVEIAVLDSPDHGASPLGHMYEFDCKALYQGATNTGYLAIQFEGEVGYVQTGAKVQTQECQGAPPVTDLITTTAPVDTSSNTVEMRKNTISSTIPPIRFSKTSRSPASSNSRPSVPSSSPSSVPSNSPPSRPSNNPSSVPSNSPPSRPSSSPSSVPSNSPPSRPSNSPSSRSSNSPSSRPSNTSPQTLSKSTPPMTTTTTTPVPTTTMTPALQYIGIGYNLLYGNPDGNPYGTAHIDEGFKLNSRILQVSGGADPRETEYTPATSTCTAVQTASMLFDAQSYQDQLRTIVTPSNTHPSDLMASAFTLSTEFRDMYPDTAASSQPTIYRDVTTTCEASEARYKTEDIPTGLFSVTPEFVTSLCQLPGTFESVAYSKFLDKWGTSIVVSSQYGQRTIDRYRISRLDAFNHVESQAPGRVHQTGAYLGHGSSLTVDTVNFTETQSAVPRRFGTLTATIVAGGPDEKVPIGARVVPLTFAMDHNLWNKVTERSIVADFCPPTFNLTTMKANLDKALQAYSAYSHAPTFTRDPLSIPVTWPKGSYGLMKSASGCPGGDVYWREGWRKYDTEDDDASNFFSTNVYDYLAGSFNRNNLITWFCMNKGYSTSRYARPWPRGHYCLLQYGSCPAGFSNGYLIWDDEDDDNSNSASGTLPTGTFDRNTRINYCCRQDGSAYTPISLPSDDPFILMRLGPTCQVVYNMRAVEVYVRWDDEDDDNTDSRGGVYPADTGGAHDHLLHFCHYSPTSGGSNVPSLVG